VGNDHLDGLDIVQVILHRKAVQVSVVGREKLLYKLRRFLTSLGEYIVKFVFPPGANGDDRGIIHVEFDIGDHFAVKLTEGSVLRFDFDNIEAGGNGVHHA